jgi:hypothetical protein
VGLYLPFLHQQSGLLGHLLGGWQINGTYRYTSGQPWTPLQNAGQGLCDPTNFTGGGFDTCRPFPGSASAPFGLVGLYCDGTSSTCVNSANVPYPVGTLASVNAGCTDGSCPATIIPAARFIINNLQSESIFGTPFSPLSRNTQRGQPISTVNMAVFKDTKLTERITFQLQAEAFNLFNHQWLGIPNVNVNNAATSQFGSLAFNSNGGDTFAGNIITDGIGRRRLQFGGKIIF